MSSRLLCRKKRRNLAENRTQWTISGFRRNFQDGKGSFRGKISIFGGKSTEYSIGMLYRQIVIALGGPFANPLREDLDVHHVVQADGAPLTPDSLKYSSPRILIIVVCQVLPLIPHSHRHTRTSIGATYASPLAVEDAPSGIDRSARGSLKG